MPKVKLHEKLFVDMTAMVDVSFLLLTFFILTSTFIQKRRLWCPSPVRSRTEVPDTNILNILVSLTGGCLLDGQPNTRKNGLPASQTVIRLFTPKQYADWFD
jgi:biopolymer transport protein ExbD